MKAIYNYSEKQAPIQFKKISNMTPERTVKKAVNTMYPAFPSNLPTTKTNLTLNNAGSLTQISISHKPTPNKTSGNHVQSFSQTF